MTDAVQFTFTADNVDWREAAALIERSGLGSRQPEALEHAFRGSQLTCFVWDDDALIGLGRALSDGVEQSAVYDVCLLDDYQGHGLGKRLMDEIMARLDTPTVLLWSALGKEGFYERFGFRRMCTVMARFDS